ncbi:hypothetical protein HDU99_007624, partial [Rhizoclosmatium hyalinum]
MGLENDLCPNCLDSSFAKTHFLTHYNNSGIESVIDYVFTFIERDNDWSGLDLLPLTYQIAICKELIRCRVSAEKLRYLHLHLFMSPRRYNPLDLHIGLPNESLLIKITDALLKDATFDEEYYILAVFNWFSNYGVLEIMEMIFNDDKIIPNDSMYLTPHGCIIEYLLKDGRAQPCNEDLIHAAKNGYYSAVEALMKDPRINPSIQDNRALKLVRTNLRRHGSVGEP